MLTQHELTLVLLFQIGLDPVLQYPAHAAQGELCPALLDKRVHPLGMFGKILWDLFLDIALLCNAAELGHQTVELSLH